VRFTSSPRRALGLVAVGALGMSTAVVGVAGVASAEPSWEAPYTFSTDPTADVDLAGVDYIEIESDTPCTIDWLLEGGAGGYGYDPDASQSVPGERGGRLTVTVPAEGGDWYDLYAGKKGEDATNGHSGLGALSGAQSTSMANGTNGYNSGGVYGGGGGAASLIESNGDYFLAAYGGDGEYADEGMGVGGFAGNNYNGFLGTTGTNGVAGSYGDGVISGSVTCEAGNSNTPSAPAAPVLSDYVEVGDGAAKVRFTPGAHSDGSNGTVWEYQLDGASWTVFSPGFTNNDDLTLSLSNLTNLKTYSVAVRATTMAGHGAASSAVSFSPFRPVAAPAGVSAKVGVSSIKISWTPAANATGTVKYVAYATPEGAQSNAETTECVTADANATSCTVGVKPGRTYWYGVVGVDKAGNEGDFLTADDATAVVPGPSVPATLPKADGTLTSDAKDGKSVAGGQVTVKGTGFLPGSTVALVVYSTPVKLGEAVVLADGTFSATVTLPKDLTDGVHNLVATGVDANGNTRNLVVEVSVSGGTAVLANTGFSALPFAGAGALALLAGGGLLLAARRRTAA
jgi:hypothetical protein